MDWTNLQSFLAVHASGSISGAAHALGVNHTTVLRRLGTLEESLGVRLFDRLPGGYVVTSAGEELAGNLSGMAEQVDAATRQVMGNDLEVRGIIRLTSTDTLFAGLLMPYLREFQERHPKVQLQMAMNNTFMSLSRREADVAVRGSNRPPENLIGRPVGRIQTAPYAAREYLASLPKKSAWENYSWIAPDESLAHLEQVKWLRANVPAERMTACMDSLVGMVECVRQGMGVGMLLCPLADRHAELVRLADPLPELDTQIWVLTHPDLKRVARIKALTDFLYEKLSIDPRLARNTPKLETTKKAAPPGKLRKQSAAK